MLQSIEELRMEQVVRQELPPMGDPSWISPFLKDCTPWYGPIKEQFLKSCSLREAHVGSIWEGLRAMLEQKKMNRKDQQR